MTPSANSYNDGLPQSQFHKIILNYYQADFKNDQDLSNNISKTCYSKANKTQYRNQSFDKNKKNDVTQRINDSSKESSH